MLYIFIFSFLLLLIKTENATRFCDINGIWDNYTNYESCDIVNGTERTLIEPHVETTTFIYIAGYSLSLIALILAVIVFVRLK